VKKKNQPTSTTVKQTVFGQICKHIPAGLASSLARETGVDKLARTFSAWSHVVAMLFAHFAHSLSLNDVCDALIHHRGVLSWIRGATPPSRNGLSHANATRPVEFIEKLFWATVNQLCAQHDFRIRTRRVHGKSRRFRGPARRVRRVIRALDSTTFKLVINCIDWALHRRRKAGLKCHLMLDLQTCLPTFVLLRPANESDPRHAPAAFATLASGEVGLFDRAYVCFAALFSLTKRGVFWVTRTKKNLRFKVVKTRSANADENILADEEVVPEDPRKHAEHPDRMRRIRALVVVDRKEREMEFLTNNLTWSAGTVAALYACRWQIETFFKEIKQTLQLKTFIGNSENAVKWQVWSALLLHVLIRFISDQANWEHGFSRGFTILRGVAWDRYCMQKLLRFYGTAAPPTAPPPPSQQPWLPGFAPKTMGQPDVTAHKIRP